MARRTKKLGIAARFGPRYGVSIKKRWKSVMEEKVAPHLCPRCQHRRVKRVSTGIWECRKCGFKFAGDAYTPNVYRDWKKVVMDV